MDAIHHLRAKPKFGGLIPLIDAGVDAIVEGFRTKAVGLAVGGSRSPPPPPPCVFGVEVVGPSLAPSPTPNSFGGGGGRDVDLPPQ